MAAANTDTNAIQLKLAFGDFIAQRYKVHRLLGRGRWSTTYLVEDSQVQDGIKFSAAKCYSASATKEGHAENHIKEARILDLLREKTECDNLPRVRGYWVGEGDSTEHLCVLLPVYCESVEHWRRTIPQKAFPVQIVKTITALVLRALDQLHGLRIVHTDVKADNVLIDGAGDDEDIAEVLKTDAKAPTELDTLSLPHSFRIDDPPSQQELYDYCLIDFSNAQFLDEPSPAQEVGAYALRAPEIILAAKWDEKIDIWAVGCLVFELLTGRWLLKPCEGEGWTLEEDHLAKMLEMTNNKAFPGELVKRAQRKAEFLKDDGTLKNITDLFPVPIEQALAAYKTLETADLAPAADFIRACLTLDPSQRPSAKEAAAHDWLVRAFG